MSTPSTPKLLAVLDRTVHVLKAITEGDVYNYTVGEKVAKGLRIFSESPGFPFDMVFLGSDHRPVEYLPDGRMFRYATVIVAAYCDEEGGEPITKLIKHLADVQLAIEADLHSTDPKSLGALIGWGHLGSVITDEGELGLEGGAGFRQDIQLCLVGDAGTL